MIVNKYDRQIRLWGVQGQRKLSHGKVALLGCTGSGIQILKNIVLPGISQIDIWQDRLVEVSDLSSSFFYTWQSVGQAKGQEVLKNLLEMNPDVVGLWHNLSINQLLNKPQILKKFNIVISCDNGDTLNRRISEVCWQNNIPVIFSSSVGFLFYIRIQTENHYVMNQSSEEGMFYLRLSNPFDELIKFSQQWNIPALLASNLPQGQQALQNPICAEISKIPFPIILLQAYHYLPQQKRKVGQVKSLLKDWINRLNPERRENFREAQKKIFDLFRSVDQFMINFQIFDNQQVKNATQLSPIFCIFLKAVSLLLSKTGKLPQPTQLPDIQTTNQLYIGLKNVYKKQHEKSKQQIIAIIQELFPNYMADENVISNLIQNMRGLQINHTNTYIQELDSPNKDSLNECEQKNTYVALRVYELFRVAHHRVPTLTDLKQLAAIAKSYTDRHSIKNFDERFLHEIGRSEGKQFISISSMVGAIGSQQSIKIITNCFCPMMNGYVYNGITSVGSQILV